MFYFGLWVRRASVFFGESLGMITKKIVCIANRSISLDEELFPTAYILIFRDVHSENNTIFRFPIPKLRQYCITLLKNDNNTFYVFLVDFLFIVRFIKQFILCNNTSQLMQQITLKPNRLSTFDDIQHLSALSLNLQR